MPKILIQLAHPKWHNSVLNRTIVDELSTHSNVTYNDLYEHYPHFLIDVQREQELLGSHDIIIFQFPFYWYSTPAILKEWMDLVLEHGYAYGKEGTALQGKLLLCMVTTGGDLENYQRITTVKGFLKPIQATADLCGMHYLAPSVIYSSHKIKAGKFSQQLPPDTLEKEVQTVAEIIRLLSLDQVDLDKAKRVEQLNADIAEITRKGEAL